MLPAGSVAVATKLWAPAGSVPVGMLNTPWALAVAKPTKTPSAYRLTVLPGSAVPVTVSPVALVTPSPRTPVSGPMPVMAGMAG